MFCINCGKELADDAKFCAWCGTQVGHGESEKAPEAAPIIPAQKKKNNGRLWVIGAAIVVVLLGIAFIGKEIVKLHQGQENRGEKTVAEVSTVRAEDTQEAVPEDTEMQENEEDPESEEPSEAEETPDIEEVPDTETPSEEITSEDTASEPTEPVTNEAAATSNPGTPQEYHGDPEGRGPGRIIVEGFDYNDLFHDGYFTPWEGEYWTASNGVEIKVISVINGQERGMIPVNDGRGKDNEPNSPFQAALAECVGESINDYAADLNVTIPLASSKRTEIDINDPNIVALRNAYDYKLFCLQGMADLYEPYEYGPQSAINLRLAVATDGVGEFDIGGGIPWRLTRKTDCWHLKIYTVPKEFRWETIHQMLRYLFPDGDVLYQVMYEDFYYGSPVIPEFDEWYACGDSQIMLENTVDEETGRMDWVSYYFK